jgi:hypothetical protein
MWNFSASQPLYLVVFGLQMQINLIFGVSRLLKPEWLRILAAPQPQKSELLHDSLVI